MSALRQSIFPIENWEIKKFLPFALIIGITVFNFTVLRNMKDALILTAPESGAEAVTYLKTLAVLPSVIFLSAMYVKLRKSCDFEKSYYIIVGSFLSFFTLFALFLYPNAEAIHFSPEQVMAWKLAFPRIQFVFPVIGVWSYSLFYVAAELWGTFCLSILFWQFANDNVGTNEAKRFYPLFLFVNAFATICVGNFLEYASSIEYDTVLFSTYMIIGMGVVMLSLFNHVNSRVLTDPMFVKDIADKGKKKSKMKLGFVDSMKQLASSPYIGYLSILILAYGMSINMIEVCWKSAAKSYYPTQDAYLAMMATYSKMTGYSGLVLVMISKGVLRRFGWLPCALVTPIMISVTGAGYFASVLFPGAFEPWMLLAGFTSPLAFTVMFGMLGVVLSKSSKYSFFDPTKEMAFIPLDYDLRISGKAAADGVAGRLGKSGASWIQMILYAVVAGGQTEIMPYLTVILFFLSIGWLVSATRLNVLYSNMVEKRRLEAESAVS